MIKNLIYLCFGLILTILSCKKPEKDSAIELPIIKLSSPEIHAYYYTSDTIFFKGSISANSLLKEVSFTLTQKITQAELLYFHANPNSTVYTIDTFYIAGADTSEYSIQIEAIDLSNNKSVFKSHIHNNKTE